MKFRNTFWTCFGAITLCSCTAFADDDMDISMQNLGSEKILQAKDVEDTPFRISARGDWIGRSKVNKKGYRNQHVNFSTVEAQAEGIIMCNEDCQEGVGIGIGYTRSRFDWHNSRCDLGNHNMDQLSFTITTFSQRLKNWLWMASVTANWEPKYSNFTDYTNYDILFWGRYACDKDFNMHIGFLAQTGMKIDRIYPVIGFDWKINDKWMLNAVFPMNMSIVYTINESWTAALAARIFDLRYRLGKREHRALFQYRNGGAELAINYNQKHFSANIHAGVTVGGQFRLSNRHNKDKRHFDLDPAGYVGGEAVVKF